VRCFFRTACCRLQLIALFCLSYVIVLCILSFVCNFQYRVTFFLVGQFNLIYNNITLRMTVFKLILIIVVWLIDDRLCQQTCRQMFYVSIPRQGESLGGADGYCKKSNSLIIIIFIIFIIIFFIIIIIIFIFIFIIIIIIIVIVAA
jgi:hypothetical protein